MFYLLKNDEKSLPLSEKAAVQKLQIEIQNNNMMSKSGLWCLLLRQEGRMWVTMTFAVAVVVALFIMVAYCCSAMWQEQYLNIFYEKLRVLLVR